MRMRIDKMLGNMGVGTRKEVKLLVRWGRVTVNGQRAWTGADYVDTDTDEVIVDGEIINFRKNVYLMLNKPAGVVSATADSKDSTVIDLVPDEFRHFDLFPVGRLDKDTEGLLIITNDGKLAHGLLSPKKHVEKKYYCRLRDKVKDGYGDAIGAGITLDDGYKTLPGKFEKISDYEGYITRMEGKFHQVKRMFIELENEVTYLKRISMGNLPLDESLELGELRELTEGELSTLRDQSSEE